MRKLIIIVLLIGGFGVGAGLFTNLLRSDQPDPGLLQASGSNPPQVQGIESRVVTISEPVSFSIPSLGVVNTTVESVGLDKEGKMDIPRDENNVAWYNMGSKPGERGNAVIAGHFDKKNGEPAVFYEINKLKRGDELKVKDKDGKEYTYAVTDVKSYELEKFPLVEVFGVGDKARLNLITCEGNYDKTSKLYSHRLVVYSELKE